MTITYQNSKTSEKIQSFLTKEKAREIILEFADLSDSFAFKMALKKSPSSAQIFWLISRAEHYKHKNSKFFEKFS